LGKPWLEGQTIDAESSSAFLREVERDKRDYPIVVLSTSHDGEYPVEPERLRSILVGLADVVCVPADEDTFSIEEVVGRRFMAFGRALNMYFLAA
jgi:hypothetical protein